MRKDKKSLAETHPEVAKQWHPSLNGDLTPSDVTPGSNKKVWWKCDKGDDHEWEAIINGRSRRCCPVCSGRKAVVSNSLLTLNPNIAKEWHPTKNGDLTPSMVRPRTAKKVWWKCDKGEDHEWYTSPDVRFGQDQNCPICSNQKVVLSNCLTTTHTEIAKQWHPTKNGRLTPYDVTAGSNKKVWWMCDKGEDHEWKTSIKHLTNGTMCPVCSGRKTVASNSLLTLNPNIAKEWHPTKNGDLTPSMVRPQSGRKVWWKCDRGEDHEWQATIIHRNKGTRCPVCSGRKAVTSNSLLTLNPEIAKQWHPTKNGGLTPYDVTAGSDKKVWWKCDRGEDHEWKAHVYNLTGKKSSCPFCNLTPQSKQELTITFELMKLFKNIDPKGLKTKLEGRLRAIDIYIPKLNLCIEFDGSYWHKDKRDIDKIKSEMLFEEGFKLIRVREEPLKKIYDSDVISKQPYNGKQVTNDILSMILSIFELDAKLVSKIKAYRSKEGLQNEKGLEKYIDKILTEKAEKK